MVGLINDCHVLLFPRFLAQQQKNTCYYGHSITIRNSSDETFRLFEHLRCHIEESLGMRLSCSTFNWYNNIFGDYVYVIRFMSQHRPYVCAPLCHAVMSTFWKTCSTSLELASCPGRLPLHSLDRICDFWTARRSGRRPGISSTSSNCKVDSIMTYVDSVSVIMATCPRTLLHVLASTTEKSTN